MLITSFPRKDHRVEKKVSFLYLILLLMETVKPTSRTDVMSDEKGIRVSWRIHVNLYNQNSSSLIGIEPMTFALIGYMYIYI